MVWIVILLTHHNKRVGWGQGSDQIGVVGVRVVISGGMEETSHLNGSIIQINLDRSSVEVST